MRFRIPQSFIFDFAERLLKEAGVEADTIEADLESFVYEAGERNWEEYDDEYSDAYYFIDWDF